MHWHRYVIVSAHNIRTNYMLYFRQQSRDFTCIAVLYNAPEAPQVISVRLYWKEYGIKLWHELNYLLHHKINAKIFTK